MRPVNLIPQEERRGARAPLRTGPLAYVVVGVLVAALAGITAAVLTDNQIAEREAAITKLEAEDARASAKAQRLLAYTEFRNLSERRVTTVASLADSRFDWERVMRELALVLPSDVWLVQLTGTAAAGVDVSGGGESNLRSSAPGPALQLSGCADGQNAVARFVTALRDIDGVTRVGVESSELGEPGNTEGGNSDEASDECRTRESIAKFEIVASFDAAPVPLTSDAEPVPVEESGSTESTSSDESSEEG